MIDKLKKQDSSLYKEIFESNFYQALPEELKNTTVFDFGANTGYFSAFASLNGAKRVYAIEPDINNFLKLLELSTHFKNIAPINLAVSKPGLKQANITSQGVGCQITENNEGRPINCISLEELLKITDDENLVLKMDCEGSEYDIFFPAPPETIKRFKYIYSEIHNNMHPNPAFNYDVFEKFMNDMGFKSSVTPAASGMWLTDGSFVGGSWNLKGDFIPNVQLYRFIKFIR